MIWIHRSYPHIHQTVVETPNLIRIILTFQTLLLLLRNLLWRVLTPRRLPRWEPPPPSNCQRPWSWLDLQDTPERPSHTTTDWMPTRSLRPQLLLRLPSRRSRTVTPWFCRLASRLTRTRSRLPLRSCTRLTLRRSTLWSDQTVPRRLTSDWLLTTMLWMLPTESVTSKLFSTIL